MSALEEYERVTHSHQHASDEFIRGAAAVERAANAMRDELLDNLRVAEAALAEYHDIYGDYGPNALPALRAEVERLKEKCRAYRLTGIAATRALHDANDHPHP